MEAGSEIDAGEGNFSFHRVDGVQSVGRDAEVRPVGVEQSNSSLVIGDELMLKVFRKLEPGINPELEMLRFLTAHEFPNIASLYGWYEYDGQALAATLGVAQEFLPEAQDGWTLATREIVEAPETFLERLGQPRRGDRADAHGARLRQRRSRLRARGAQPGGAVAAHRHRR